jgi:predicted deacetylase
MKPPQVCVVLHDVAPATALACRRLMTLVDTASREAGVAVPVTLLVVPRLHGHTSAPPAYLRWLRGLAEAGHELALHGETHLDDLPTRGLADTLRRRIYTAGEGEFAALPLREARRRIARARGWAHAHGLPVRGFVPPAWLLGPQAQAAVVEAGFDYTCSFGRITALPGSADQRALALTASTRSAWRRAVSRVWLRVAAIVLRKAPLLRLELHPADAKHPALLALWAALMRDALETRQPVTLAAAAAALRDAATRPAHTPPHHGALR